MKGSDTREFQFRNFRVAVPRLLLEKWDTTPAKERWEILDSLVAISDDRVRRSNYALHEPVIEGLRAHLDFDPLDWKEDNEERSLAEFRRSWRRLKRMTSCWLDSDSSAAEAEESDEDYQAGVLDEVRRLREMPMHRKLQECVLSLLKFEHYRDWSRSHIAPLFKRAVVTAVEDGDEKFFKALGEILKEKPIRLKTRTEPMALKGFLIEHWLVSDGICFCWFTDEALLEFLKQTVLAVSLDAIRKTRQRLRLRKLRRPLVRRVARTGDRIVLS